MITDLSVCITSFKRAGYLDRAINSVKAAGIQNIVVASDEPDELVEGVLLKHHDIIVSTIGDDGGCNNLWMRAAYHSPTKRLIILHDDDVLSPKLGQVYNETIKPAMDDGSVEFASWRAHLMFDDGRIKPIEWFNQGQTKKQNSAALRDFVIRPGRLSLSPIISIFNRDVLIHSLKESHQYLTKNEACLLRPGMLLGTEIVAYLRHCAEFGNWMFINEVLSYYGACETSGTVKAEKSGDLSPLIKGYDVARNYFRSGQYAAAVPEPRIIFVHDDTGARDKDEQRRFDYAYHTWMHHFNSGYMLEFPTNLDMWSRSSKDLGDPSPVPYFKDLIDYGISRARPEDIVVYANRDICLTTHAHESIVETVKRNGVAVAWRRNFVPKPSRLYMDVTHARRDGGIDLLAISPAWWKAHKELIPDQFIGRECYDWCFRTVAEERNGKGVYVDNVIYHEPHESFWRKNKKTNPGQIHNRSLAKVFFARRRDARALKSLQ